MENKTNTCFPTKNGSVKCLSSKKKKSGWIKLTIGIIFIISLILGIKFYFFRNTSWKDFFLMKFLSSKNNTDDNSTPDTIFGGQPSNQNAQCYIEGEDIFNGRTFTKSGTQIKDAPFMVECSKCSNYVYRDSSGNCANYLYDKTEQEPVTEPEEWPGAPIKDANGKDTGKFNTGVCEPNPNPSGKKCLF